MMQVVSPVLRHSQINRVPRIQHHGSQQRWYAINTTDQCISRTSVHHHRSARVHRVKVYAVASDTGIQNLQERFGT